MPHMTLDYTDNIKDKIDFKKFFKDLHEIISGTLGVTVDKCKSKAFSLNNYFIADGKTKDAAYVHLEIALFEGRTPVMKSSLGKLVLELLQEYFVVTAQTMQLTITIELREMKRDDYFRYATVN